jgi:threonine/homoserine/homoserine lactone efflux protein
MEHLPALLGIATALAVGAASPGPSFVVVARTAVSSSRVDAVCAALGMGVGGLLFAVASLAGLHGVLLAVPSLYWVLKIIGGLYLIYLGVHIWLGASKPLFDQAVEPGLARMSAARSFGLGLTTQLSNPKTAIVYSSVFAAFLPASTPLAFNLLVGATVFSIEVGWYAVVAVALSAHGPRLAYLRYKAWIDRVAGGVMVALGMKLVHAADRQ